MRPTAKRNPTISHHETPTADVQLTPISQDQGSDEDFSRDGLPTVYTGPVCRLMKSCKPFAHSLLFRQHCLCLLLLFFCAPVAAGDVNPTILPLVGQAESGGAQPLSVEEREFLQRKGRVSMCVDPDWLPLEKIEDGVHVGIAADYMAIMQRFLEVPIELVSSDTWTQSVELAKARKCDIFSLAMQTPERREYMAFTKPYLRFPLVLATQYHKPFVADITLLANKKLGVVRGYAFGELLRQKYPQLQIVDVDSVVDGLDKVERGSLYGFIGALATVGYELQMSYPELKIAGKFDEYWELGVGVRNDEPLLLSSFEKAVASINDSQSQDILNRWISVKYEEAMDFSSIWQGLAIISLLVVFLLYRQRMLERHNRELLELTRTDALTGVGSRHYLDQELSRLLEHYQRYERSFSIMVIDLDYFKEVNDRFGHPTGDRVLIEFVGLVGQHLRKTDIFGRWGGEEFLIICPNTDLKQVVVLAERIRNATASHTFEETGRQTVSIGLATCANKEITTARLVAVADKALYAAKAAGRNRVVGVPEHAETSTA
jgi:polar amino acid transport system substrate-binding protein